MTEQTLFLVSDESGCLVGIYPTIESAEKFIANHGLESWTIDEDVMC